MQRHVTLRRRLPKTDTSYYRRREPGAALAGRLAQYRPGRRLLQWALLRGKAAAELRETFGRAPETMHAQADLPRDASVLRTIVRESNQCAGLYASVAAPGRVAVFDPVRLSAPGLEP